MNIPFTVKADSRAHFGILRPNRDRIDVPGSIVTLLEAVQSGLDALCGKSVHDFALHVSSVAVASSSTYQNECFWRSICLLTRPAVGPLSPSTGILATTYPSWLVPPENIKDTKKKKNHVIGSRCCSVHFVAPATLSNVHPPPFSLLAIRVGLIKLAKLSIQREVPGGNFVTWVYRRTFSFISFTVAPQERIHGQPRTKDQ